MEVKSCFPYIGPNVKSVEKIWTSRGGAEGRTWPLKLWITRLGREFWSLHCSLALTKYDFWTSSQQDRHYLKQELFCLHRSGFQSVINTSFKLNFPWKTTIKGMNYLLNLGYSWWNLELRVASVEPKPLLSFCHDHNNRMFNHRQRMSWPRGFLCLSCSKAKNSQAAMAQICCFPLSPCSVRTDKHFTSGPHTAWGSSYYCCFVRPFLSPLPNELLVPLLNRILFR